MFKILFIAFLTLQSLLLVYSQSQETTYTQETMGTVEEFSPDVEGLQITLGRDSPNLGGNTFRDAFIALTLTDTLGVSAAKITNEISFPNRGEIAFDRAELPPDLEASGATLEIENNEPEGETTTVRITISGKAPLRDGILLNMVFRVIQEFTLDEIGTGEHLIPLENKVTAWTSDEQEIAEVVSEPGEIDLADTPVVFACFFYMH